jgi:hypothetical protein
MPSVLGPLNQAKADDGVMNGEALDETFDNEDEAVDEEQVASDNESTNEDDDEGEDSQDTSIDPSQRLINTGPINLQNEIEDPVTSGGDVVIDNPSN